MQHKLLGSRLSDIIVSTVVIEHALENLGRSHRGVIEGDLIARVILDVVALSVGTAGADRQWIRIGILGIIRVLDDPPARTVEIIGIASAP